MNGTRDNSGKVSKSADTPQPKSLRILHVLTLSGARGEYGGPNKVARELCSELQKRGHTTQIFTGAQANSIPDQNQQSNEAFEIVHSLNHRFPISSLWSKKLPKKLFSLVKTSDIVHIHFARDLIPMLAAFICIILKKPYFTQTHGMVVPDKRLSTKVFDFMFTRSALKHSQMNFVLSSQEQSEVSPLRIKCPIGILPNGIEVSETFVPKAQTPIPNVIFCSRLHIRKRPEWFLNLAAYANQKGIDANFLIYGPDGGQLEYIEKQILSNPKLSRVEYRGALAPNEVQDVLSQSAILVLPSENEPFPMIVLEALAVGTPTLIMPSCGISKMIQKVQPELIATSEDEKGLFSAFTQLFNKVVSHDNRVTYHSLCLQLFDIRTVTSKLEDFYNKAV